MLLPLSLLLSLSTTLAVARPSISFDSDSLAERNNDGSSSSSPTVTINNGTVEGISIANFNQEGQYAFLLALSHSLLMIRNESSFPWDSVRSTSCWRPEVEETSELGERFQGWELQSERLFGLRELLLNSVCSQSRSDILCHR